MRHGGRAYLVGDHLLAKVTDRNVTPDVAVKVQDNGIEPLQAVAQFGDVVMRFDLCGVRVPF